MNDMDRIGSALAFIPADDRETWLRMGMAVKSELGDSGFDLWDEWSQQAESYDPSDARAVWRGIKPGGGIGIGTLFHEAKASGWQDSNGYQRPSAEDIADRNRKAAERAASDQEAIDRERQAAAGKASAIMRAAVPARADHPYLERKGVAPVDTLREIDAEQAFGILAYRPKAGGEHLTGCLLVVPVKQGDAISTLELIDGDGRKAALAGRGTKAGGFWATERLPAGDGDGVTLLIGEGVATVLSASEATGHPAVAALSSGNLVAVAKAMRGRYPAAELVILADLVKASGKPDTHAVDAARAVGGNLAVPDFGTDRPSNLNDFNDLAVTVGMEAVRSAVASASEIAGREHQPGEWSVPAGDYTRSVNLIRASDMTPEPIAWIWEGWLAAGKMHVLGGAPGTGKTTIAMALAATVTIGGRWPDGSRAMPGNVVIWSGEDDPADTLIPRLELSGADLTRVYFIADILEGSERRAFDPARDMEPLQRKLSEIGGVRLLIVDPIVSAIAGDSHKNAEVRRGLQPLVDLAGAMRCALLGITHFSKGTGGRDPVERLTGSLAFGALARVVLVAAKHQEEGEDGRTTRLFCRAKSNIGPDDGGFEYDLHQDELRTFPGVFASSVLWGNTVEGDARDLLATADATGDDGEGGESVASVSDWLRDLLSEEGGSLDRREVMKAAHAMGHKERTVHRAREKLGLLVRQTGFGKDKRSIWTLPDGAMHAPIMPCMPNKLSGMHGTHGGAHGEDRMIEVEI